MVGSLIFKPKFTVLCSLKFSNLWARSAIFNATFLPLRQNQLLSLPQKQIIEVRKIDYNFVHIDGISFLKRKSSTKEWCPLLWLHFTLTCVINDSVNHHKPRGLFINDVTQFLWPRVNLRKFCAEHFGSFLEVQSVWYN